MVKKPVPYIHVHSAESNRVDEVILETACCNRPAATVVAGRKSEDVPLENSTFFWTELQAPAVNRRSRTTARIGLDQTEN